MEITIVGGGIAGLAAAVGLGRAGHRVTVLERAREPGPVGTGLLLWPNALRALDEIGIGDRVRAGSRRARGPAIRDRRGRELSRTDVPELERRFGPLLVIHRADLLRALAQALPPGVRLCRGTVVGSARADGAVAGPAGEVRADLVVGADGIGSVVRRDLWPAAARPRYLGYRAYRMLTGPTDARIEGESWGRGLRVGYAPLRDGRVYCFAAISAPPGLPALDLPALCGLFRGWHEPIPELLGSVPQGSVLSHDLYALPPLTGYASGRAVLVGDAAHAMAPDLGQGAGQALEDAVTLAAVLAGAPGGPDLAGALRTYDRLRRPRARAIAARSRGIGAVAQLRSRPAAAARDLLLRCVPDRAVLAALAPVLSWRPPTRR